MVRYRAGLIHRLEKDLSRQVEKMREGGSRRGMEKNVQEIERLTSLVGMLAMDTLYDALSLRAILSPGSPGERDTGMGIQEDPVRYIA